LSEADRERDDAAELLREVMKDWQQRYDAALARHDQRGADAAIGMMGTLAGMFCTLPRRVRP